ncbi:MAG: GCN5-related N-acetyltransferase [Linnemannia gamsii]|nr:MAG: GCN5-related N-acetyltransferase [Linnemannia gamsii]
MTGADNTTPSPTPTRGSTVTLREINKENWCAVTELSVAESQSAILTSNLKSLCESHYAEDAWVRAVYADETLVGFMMLSIWPVEDWYAIWRFMIDQKFQSLGFGRKAILLAINHITTHYPEAKQIRLMTAGPEGKKDVEAKDSPYKFYAGLGWKDISGYDEDGEVEMGLDLQR